MFVCFWRDSPQVGQGLLFHQVSRSYSTTHHSQQDASGQVISTSPRPLPDNTQRSQQTDIHAPGGIRTHNLSRPAATDLRLDRAATGTCITMSLAYPKCPKSPRYYRRPVSVGNNRIFLKIETEMTPECRQGAATTERHNLLTYLKRFMTSAFPKTRALIQTGQPVT